MVRFQKTPQIFPLEHVSLLNIWYTSPGMPRRRLGIVTTFHRMIFAGEDPTRRPGHNIRGTNRTIITNACTGSRVTEQPVHILRK